MFFKADIKVEEIVPTIKTLRSERGRVKELAFKDLSKRFEGLIKGILSSVKSEIKSMQDGKKAHALILKVFWKILMSPTLKLKNPKAVTKYIEKTLKLRINKNVIKKELGGEDTTIKQLTEHRWQFKNALKRFKKKYKRMPNFRDRKDRIEFSKIMKIKEKNLDSHIKNMDPKIMQSIYDSVSKKDEGGAVSELMHYLEDPKTAPESVLRNREILRVLLQSVDQLPPDQRKVFRLFYLQPQKKKKTKDDLAQEAKMTKSKFKNTLDKARENLRRSPLLKKLYTEAEMKRQIKLAMQEYCFIKKGNNHLLRRKSPEDLISEILDE